MRPQAFDADQRAIVYAPGEGRIFTPGDHVRILVPHAHRTASHAVQFPKRGTESVIRSRRSTTTKSLSLERPSQSRTTTVSPSQ
jgi:hypothetical protein